MTDETFMYVIARPWDLLKPFPSRENMCIYTYFDQIHSGTKADAFEMLEHIKDRVRVSSKDQKEQDTAMHYQVVRLTPEIIKRKAPMIRAK